MAKNRKKKKGKDVDDHVIYPGFWGNVRALYLKEHQPRKFAFLQENYLLEPHLNKIQKAYEARAKSLMERLTKKHIDETLQDRDCVAWLAETFRMEKDVRKFLVRKLQK